jgi:hypothetical protein
MDHSPSIENTSLSVRSEVFTDVPMKNVVFWTVTPCGSCKNRRIGGTYRAHHQGEKNQRARCMLVIANVPSSLILFTLMMGAICSFETSVLTRVTRCQIAEDGNITSPSGISERLRPSWTLDANCRLQIVSILSQVNPIQIKPYFSYVKLKISVCLIISRVGVPTR